MTFRETIEKIRAFKDVQIDCKHFVIRSTFSWSKLNEEFIQLAIERGVNPAKDKNCLSRKIIAEQILQTLETETDKIEPPFSPLKRLGSIYPLQ
jgi:hypothetical protein